ncbi:MAG: SDR family oxidoreductase [Burkholderiales bacterium]|nr:SDR family oxidoreductase [Burkholderiales bacterium]
MTGGSSGIGFELARQYLESGAIVGITSRDASRLEYFGQRWPDRAVLLKADVRNMVSMKQAAALFLSLHGVPDLVYANAGISIGNLTWQEQDVPVFEEILDTNVTGMVRTFQPYIAAMRQRGEGKLVGIASIAGFRGLPGASAYSASKAAAICYLEGLRAELYDSGIRVITICPGYVDTPMTSENPYPMPFLVPVAKAASGIIRSVETGRLRYTFPWQMRGIGMLLRMLPDRLHAFLFSRAPHKPRRGD